MNAVISKDRLAWVLKGLAPAVKKRAVVPAMLNVELSVNKELDILTAFCVSHEGRMEIQTPVLGNESGVAVVKFDTLEKFVNACNGSDVTLATDEDDSLTVVCGRSKIRINGFPEDMSPRIIVEGTGESSSDNILSFPDNVFFIKSREFLTAFKPVGYTTAKDNGEAPAYLAARYVSVGTDGYVTCAATDARRLLETVRRVFNEEENAPAVKNECSALIPAGASETMQAVLAWTSPETLVSFGIGDKTLSMSAKNVDVAGSQWSCSFSLLSAQYPNYRQLLPMAGWDIKATLPREAFIDSLRRVMLMAMDDDPPTVAMEIKGEGECFLSAQGKTGDARDEFECTLEGGPMIQIKCNGRFLLDALLAGDFGGGDVLMYFKSSLDSIHILSAAEDFHYVLMPMRD